ncbi:NAD(P)/FAD-dependent oxidoreductase OS=Streptomyces alboniger OX=132473 GN=CP975_29855 PE=4 SV=1 [Streptomyces alboniger]
MRRFRDDRARALFAGLVAHVIAPLDGIVTGGVGMVFALAAHARGWPVARGGSQSIADALTAYLTDLGGSVHTDYEVKRLDELPPARAYVFDTSPTALARIAGLGNAYESYRYGAGVFKVDYALDGPVPWTAEEARSAGTVQVGADSREIGAALRAVSREGRVPDAPFLITTQPGIVDPSRAPAGKHVFWAYGHVPNGWQGDLTDATSGSWSASRPASATASSRMAGPPELAERNANYVGGDIACGAASGLQLLLRPKLSLFPYGKGHPAVFICSSATPPAPGVHGMSGHNAAKAVWKRLRAAGNP